MPGKKIFGVHRIFLSGITVWLLLSGRACFGKRMSRHPKTFRFGVTRVGARQRCFTTSPTFSRIHPESSKSCIRRPNVDLVPPIPVPPQPTPTRYPTRKHQFLFDRLNRHFTWDVGKIMPASQSETEEWKIECIDRANVGQSEASRSFIRRSKNKQTRSNGIAASPTRFFDSEEIRQRHAIAIDSLIQSLGRMPIYVGKLTIEPVYRRLGIAPLLCQAAGALGELREWNIGITFATIENRAAKMYCRMGAVPIVGSQWMSRYKVTGVESMLLRIEPNSCQDDRVREATRGFATCSSRTFHRFNGGNRVRIRS